MDGKSGRKNYSEINISDDVLGVIGVCGVVGNLVARVLMDNGFKVTGTDIWTEKECRFKYTLNDYNLSLYLGGHPELFFEESNFILPPPSLSKESNLSKQLEIDVSTGKYKILEVEDVLDLIKPDKPVICVTGTNGKTTTVSLLKHICKYVGLNPSEHGFQDLQGNIEYIPPLQCRLKGDVAVLETGTFGNPGDLKFMVERSRPECGLITNITPDHMHDSQDFLKYAAIKGEFIDYLKNKKLIVNGDDPTVWGLIKSKITDHKKRDIVTFGVDSQIELETATELNVEKELIPKTGTNTKSDIFNDKLCLCGRKISVKETISGMGDYKCFCGLEKPVIDYLATDIKENSFILHTPQQVFKVKNPLLGLHNVYNILGAIATAVEFFDIPFEDITSAITSFSGVPGRLDYIGQYNGKNVIVDYAHNPGGVETVLRELKKIYKTVAVVITVSSESGDHGNTEILNKCLSNADYVIPASYYSRKAADRYQDHESPGPRSNKIILTPQHPEEFKKGTLGANLDQITVGVETALRIDVEAIICIGEAAFKFKENIRDIILCGESQI